MSIIINYKYSFVNNYKHYVEKRLSKEVAHTFYAQPLLSYIFLNDNFFAGLVDQLVIMYSLARMELMLVDNSL